MELLIFFALIAVTGFAVTVYVSGRLSILQAAALWGFIAGLAVAYVAAVRP